MSSRFPCSVLLSEAMKDSVLKELAKLRKEVRSQRDEFRMRLDFLCETMEAMRLGVSPRAPASSSRSGRGMQIIGEDEQQPEKTEAAEVEPREEQQTEEDLPADSEAARGQGTTPIPTEPATRDEPATEEQDMSDSQEEVTTEFGDEAPQTEDDVESPPAEEELPAEEPSPVESNNSGSEGHPVTPGHGGASLMPSGGRQQETPTKRWRVEGSPSRRPWMGKDQPAKGAHSAPASSSAGPAGPSTRSPASSVRAVSFRSKCLAMAKKHGLELYEMTGGPDLDDLVGMYVARHPADEATYFRKVLEPGGSKRNVFLYKYDEPEEYRGWWLLGDRLSGEEVFGYNPDNSTEPPASGWRIPYDGEERPGFKVTPVAGTLEAAAERAEAKCAAEAKEQAAKAEAERLEAERLEAKRLAAQRAAAERAAAAAATERAAAAKRAAALQAHQKGRCRPCYYNQHGHCLKGAGCDFCHLHSQVQEAAAWTAGPAQPSVTRRPPAAQQLQPQTFGNPLPLQSHCSWQPIHQPLPGNVQPAPWEQTWQPEQPPQPLLCPQAQGLWPYPGPPSHSGAGNSFQPGPPPPGPYSQYHPGMPPPPYRPTPSGPDYYHSN